MPPLPSKPGQLIKTLPHERPVQSGLFHHRALYQHFPSFNLAMTHHTTDVIIIGAGPVGLFAVFELGLLKMKAHLIDVLDKPGGQCAELYPEKPIYDIPGIPEITGNGLTQGLLKQHAPFDPIFHLNQTVTQLESLSDDPTKPRWCVTTDTGTSIEAPVVFIAAGNGVFTPRKLDKPGATEAEAAGRLHYAVRNRTQFEGKKLLLLGGGDSAFDWANVYKVGADVTLMHRSTKFAAAPASVEAFMADEAASDNVHFRVGNVTSLAESSSGSLIVTFDDGTTENFDYILAFFGLVAKLGPIESWDFPLTNRFIPVSTTTYETDKPGIFAIGDVNTYDNKRKLILSGFHEAALAAHKAHDYVFPGRPLLFQYTTGSSVIHQRLGKS